MKGPLSSPPLAVFKCQLTAAIPITCPSKLTKCVGKGSERGRGREEGKEEEKEKEKEKRHT